MCCCRGLAVEEFPLLLLTVGEYIAARRGLGGFSKADALAGKRAEVGLRFRAATVTLYMQLAVTGLLACRR